MKTHNFYADLILSLRTFFDKIVFPNSEIKGYRFNIGNRSLQLNYDTKFDLPWMVIDFQSSRHVAYHSHTWLHSQFDNISKYTVLYNKTKNLSLLMQEELFEFQVQATLNCESQLSALYFKHEIERYLIVGRYFQLYSFFSFFTIDDKLLHEDMFDVNNDQIYNLFMKYDPLTDNTIYSYSVKYEPLIRIESSESTISSSEQRSFPVTISLNIINPMPIYTEIPVYERAKPGLTKEISQLDVFVPIDSRFSIASIDIKTSNNHYFAPALLHNNRFNCDISYIKYDISTQIPKSLYEFNGNLTGIVDKLKSIGQFKTIINNINYEVDYELTNDVSDNVFIIRLFGPISGVIVQCKYLTQFGPNYISGWFTGFIDGISNKIIIEGQLYPDSTASILDEHQLTIINSTEQIKSFKIIPQPYGNLNHLITEFNSRLLRLNINKTTVTEIVFHYNLKLYTKPISIVFDDAGNYKQSFDFIIDGNPVKGCIFGKLHPIKLNLTSTYNINDDSFIIVSLKFNFKFKSSIGYGAPIIDKMNINITDALTPVSSAIGSASYFKNEFIEIEDRNNKLLLQNIILSNDQISDFFIPIPNSTDVKIKVVLSPDFNFDIMSQNNSLYWRFYLNLDRSIIDLNTIGIEVVKQIGTTFPNIIYFKCIEDIFNEYFRNKIDVDNPIFFQLYKLY